MNQHEFDINALYESVDGRVAIDCSGIKRHLQQFRRVFLWGAGRLGTDTCARLLHMGLSIDGVWDSKAPELGTHMFGVPVSQPYSIDAPKNEDLIIVCIGAEEGRWIASELRHRGFQNVLDGKRLMAVLTSPFHDPFGRPLFDRFGETPRFKLQTSDGMLLNARAESGKQTYIVCDGPVDQSLANEYGPPIKSLDSLSDDEIKDALFLVCFEVDSEALPVLRRIRKAGGRFIPHINPVWEKTNYRFVSMRAHLAMRKTWDKAARLSHLIPIVHENICEALEITRKVAGDYVEIGVYLGGSACTALNYLELIGPPHKKAWLLDTFNGFNYPEAQESVDGLWAGTHGLFGTAKTMEFIKETLTDINVDFELVQSNICNDQLPAALRSIAVANIDVDMYEPTLAAFHKVAPLVTPGGIIIAEDPASTPGTYGAFMAMHDFLESSAGQRFKPIFKQGQYFLMARN